MRKENQIYGQETMTQINMGIHPALYNHLFEMCTFHCKENKETS